MVLEVIQRRRGGCRSHLAAYECGQQVLVLRVLRQPGWEVLAGGPHHGVPTEGWWLPKHFFLWKGWQGPVSRSTLQVTAVKGRKLSQDRPGQPPHPILGTVWESQSCAVGDLRPVFPASPHTGPTGQSAQPQGAVMQRGPQLQAGFGPSRLPRPLWLACPHSSIHPSPRQQQWGEGPLLFRGDGLLLVLSSVGWREPTSSGRLSHTAQRSSGREAHHGGPSDPM